MYFGGLIAALAVDAFWGICLYEVHYFFYPENRWWYENIPGFISSFLVSIVILFSFIININKYSTNGIFTAPQAKWLVALLLFMCIVGLYALNPMMHWKFFVEHSKLLIIIAIAFKVVDSKKKFEWLMVFYLLGNFYLGWEAFSVGRIVNGRVEGIGTVDGPDSNDTAAIMITAIPIYFYYFMNEKKKWRQGIALVGMVFVANGIVLINSRGSFLGLLVSFCYILFHIFFYKRNLMRQYRKKALFFFIGSIGLFIYLADTAFWERMLTLVQLGESVQEGESVGRIYFWLKSIDVLNEYPLGTGCGGFQVLSPKLLPEEMLYRGSRAVHSTPFQVAAEYGYIGIFLFGGLLISNFAMFKKMKRISLEKNDVGCFFKALTIEASLIAFLIASLFIDRYYSVVLYWMMLFTACFYNIYFLKKDQQPKFYG